MADDIKDENGNGTKVVPIAVLDRFLKVARENSESYGSMVSAVDAISARVMEMADAISGLTGTIEEEKLSEVLNLCTSSIREDVKKLQEMMGSLAEPRHNILKSIAEYLKYKKADEREVQEVAKSLVWFMGILTCIRNNSGKLLFLAGVACVTVLGANGLTMWDAVKMFLK